jgi:hypothetical protein
MADDPMPRDDLPIPLPSSEAPPGYRTQSEDTSYWAERLWFEHLRTLDARETAALVNSACRMLDELLLAGLRREHPNADDEELEWRAAARKYGREFVERFTGRTLPRP